MGQNDPLKHMFSDDNTIGKATLSKINSYISPATRDRPTPAPFIMQPWMTSPVDTMALGGPLSMGGLAGPLGGPTDPALVFGSPISLGGPGAFGDPADPVLVGGLREPIPMGGQIIDHGPVPMMDIQRPFIESYSVRDPLLGEGW